MLGLLVLRRNIFFIIIPYPQQHLSEGFAMSCEIDTAASAQIMVRDPTHPNRPTSATTLRGCGALDPFEI